MIVNRLDHLPPDIGLGFKILETGAFDPHEIEITLSLLSLRRDHYGEGVVAIDCGANIGAYTVEWARKMHGWGKIIAVEAQERIYYALAGNIAINNCFNARAVWAAVSNHIGAMEIPTPDYQTPSSFGSLELRKREGHQYIGQPIDYSEGKGELVQTITIDSLGLRRIDLIKIDIEGMEIDALEGAARSLAEMHPILIVEQLKSDQAKLLSMLKPLGYRCFAFGIDLVCVHHFDPALSHINATEI
jgi:FkbM family methyltransferase